MSLPKEPRQLMINLMYLVLTAMLALNVSSEILHAFQVINQSITSSNSAIEAKNNELYKSFDEQENQEGQKDRVKPFNDKAKQARKLAQDMIAYLNDVKERVIEESGGYEDDGEIKRKDNIDAATFLLVEHKGGDTLKSNLLELREKFLSLVSDPYRESVAKDLPIKIAEVEKNDNNPQGDWSTAYFHNMPTMAVVTLISKFQNDIRNSESIIVNQLAKEAGDIQVKFDAFQAIAIPTPSYALEGQKVTASVLLAAYNNQINPEVTYSSGHETRVDSGIAHWEEIATGIGVKTVKGTVSIDLGGRKETREYSFQYTVGSTGASIQLDKMNVFYIGVPNPITVSAAGYSLQDVSVSIDGADVQEDKEKGIGHYIIKVNKPGEVDANIMAKTAEKGVVKVGGMKVRVKFIPDPTAKIAGKTGGAMPSNIFKAQQGILAVLDNFDFDARFVVTSYEFSMLPKRGELLGPYKVQGPYLKKDKNVAQLIDRAKPGDRVYIEEIRARGPDGRTRALTSITLLLL